MERILCFMTLIFALTQFVSAIGIIESDVVRFSESWKQHSKDPENRLENLEALKGDYCESEASYALDLCVLFKHLDNQGDPNSIGIARYARPIEYLYGIRVLLDRALSPNWPLDASKRQLFAVKQLLENAQQVLQVSQPLLIVSAQFYLSSGPFENLLEETFGKDCFGVPGRLLTTITRPEVRSIVCALERHRRGLADFTEWSNSDKIRQVLMHILSNTNSGKQIDLNTELENSCRGFERAIISHLYYSLVIDDSRFDAVPTDHLLFKVIRQITLCEDIKFHKKEIVEAMQQSKPNGFINRIKSASSKF